MSQTTPGGELEQAVLDALWKRERASTLELYDLVGVPRGLVYTTVAKVLDRLFTKRLVTRRREGRTYVYEPARDRQRIQRAHLLRLLKPFFRDDTDGAVAPLIDAIESIDPALLDALWAEVKRRRRR